MSTMNSNSIALNCAGCGRKSCPQKRLLTWSCSMPKAFSLRAAEFSRGSLHHPQLRAAGHASACVVCSIPPAKLIGSRRATVLALAEYKDSVPREAARSLPAWSGDYSPGDVLGQKYTVVEVIGRGSNAVTYRATAADAKDVAIKALSLRRMTGWKQLELFEREAKVLESLNHPGIPRYIDFFEEDSERDRGFFLVQELAQGKSLAELVEGGWRADEAEARRIAIEMLGILAYLASRRPPVTHRDIKPENIVLEGGQTGGRVFLVDFGGVQAAAASEALGMASTVIGTYGHMAPEQFRGAAQPASDLYGLGGTLLYLLSGRRPSEFPQERMQIAFRDAVDVSPELASVLEGLLEPLVEERIAASDALSILAGEKVSAGQLVRDGVQPPGARARVREKRDTLRIDIPPASLASAERVGLAGFAVTWNVGIGVWTASALAAGSVFAAAFSIPFWAAGFSVAREALRSTLAEERVQLDRRSWSITLSGRLQKKQDAKPAVEGRTRDLRAAQVVVTGFVNGTPRTEIKLLEGFREHRFGSGLSTMEQQWIATKINSYLQHLPGQPAPQLPPPPSQTASRNPQRWPHLLGGTDAASWQPFTSPFFSPFSDDVYEPNIVWEEEAVQEYEASQRHGTSSTSSSSSLGGSAARSERAADSFPADIEAASQGPAHVSGDHELSHYSSDDLTGDNLGLISAPDDSFAADFAADYGSSDVGSADTGSTDFGDSNFE